MFWISSGYDSAWSTIRATSAVAKFRFRDLQYKYPWLYEASTRLLAFGCDRGTRFLTDAMCHTRVVHPESSPILNGDGAFSYAVLHGSMAAILAFRPRARATLLVSNSRDGEMIARASLGMGFGVARGSSARGGARAALELIAAVEAGQRPIFMVDGPKGPRHEVKPGIIWLSKQTGIPILPFGYRANYCWDINSWDKYDASSWGSPTVSVVGKPLWVAADSTDDQLEQQRLKLQSYMLELDELAYSYWSAINTSDAVK